MKNDNAAPDGKTVSFRSKSRREGFTQVDNPVLLSEKLTAPAKVVWGLLCYFARQDEECWPGQTRMAAMVPCSERALRGYIDELKGVGLIDIRRRGLGKTNVYTLGDVDYLFGAADRQNRPVGAAESAGLEQQDPPVPTSKKTQRNNTQRKKTAAYPTTINGRKVSNEDGAKALLILAHWNEIFGQHLAGRSWLEKILRRMAEHPELTAEDHRAIIAAVKAGDKWWRGDPDPRIVYGSDGQFESCMMRRSTAASVHCEGDEDKPERDWDATVIG